MDANSGIVIGSEVFLALYPILIKLVPTNLTTQVVARFLVFTGLGALFAKSSSIQETWFTTSGAFTSLLFGTLTLFHVGVSYYSFSKLPAGTAMSLFYTYPIWILLGAIFFFNEPFSLFNFFLVSIAIVGVYLVSKKEEEEDKEKSYDTKAILAALAAAITEAIMYFIVKSKNNPFHSILQLYPGGLLVLLASLFITKDSVSTEPSIWLPLILFNAIIGFAGYALRFYAIPHVKTIVFSLLTFVGVIASFGWGYLFAEETASDKTLLGALLISGAAGMTKYV
jgi:drug/metabolite transporter (DMT)-like permease